MTAPPIDSARPFRDVHKRRLTHVALATTIGTAIEAFDFLAFGTAAALVFNSLVGMGAATVLIGLLPTYGTIALWAAVLLVVLRILQGLSVGGELGGAVVLAVEHAPERYKSFNGLPQTAAPIGLLLATSAFAASPCCRSRIS